MTKLTKSLNIRYQALPHHKFFMKLTKQGYFAKILNLLSTENSAVKSAAFYYQDLVEMQLSPLHKSQEEFCFLSGSFLITKSLNLDSFIKKSLCSIVDLLVRVILLNIYKIYKRFFHFSGRREV